MLYNRISGCSCGFCQKGYSENSKNKVVLDSTGEDYVVSSWIENPFDIENSVSSLRSIQSISQGHTITHNVNVGSGVNYLEVDLNWGDTSDSLTLSVYTPSGSKLGTYSDNSDGSVNGRIRINIDPSQGYVQQGTWKFKVYGESVSGTQSYTFGVALH
ncbi:pre-peptidase C-terminal domain-containing protein [Methanosarcina spelaei]|uniref:pre-peptidase C-terminal domain-containing protein n=1 Tax=Methanosarcina spelaei TaxID=1036679 RepID=UPI001FE96DF8|nr:pre-peptidase C-terminal domain-containing protein [Methanosarcina spelaei]